MAVVEMVRPRYNPRGEVVLYVRKGKMCARAWPKHEVRNPRTAAQTRQRSKFAVAMELLRGFQPLLARGFRAQGGDGTRTVGGFHRALGLHLRNGAVAIRQNAVQIDFARVQISEGDPSPLGTVRYRIVGRKLHLAWEHPAPPHVRELLVGHYNHALRASGSLVMALEAGSRAASMTLPEGISRGPIELYVAPWAHERNGGQWASVHLHIDPVAHPESPGYRPPIAPPRTILIEAMPPVNVRHGMAVPPLPYQQE